MRHTRFQKWTLGAFVLPALVVAFTALGAPRAQAAAVPAGNFFIITSVNLRMHELFLKAPTEVTELMLVNGNTTFLDQSGKRIALKDLRAGDTVYVESTHAASGEALATRIEIGPMTVQVLHARYLSYK